MGFIHLLVVASIPVAKVLLIIGVGMFLALERIDLLGENARNHLNKIVFYVFSPSLIAANLAKTVTLHSFLSLWFMPINILVAFIIGAILGWLLVKISRPPKHLKGLIIGACSAGNMGIFPIILIPAICKEKGSPFGAIDVCETYALSYSSLSLAIGAVYIWSLVYNIVRMSAEEITRDKGLIDSSGIHIKDSNQEPLLPCSEDHCLAASHQVSLSVKISQCIRTFLGKANLKVVFAPSTIAAIFGFAIGMISPIQKLMIGSEAPLHVITDSAFMLGEAAIPVLTIILGANLLQGLKGTGLQLRVILGIVVTRYVLLPLFGILIVKGALQAGLVPSNNKLFVFLLLLQYAMPPAINLGTMTQLFGAGRSECSVIMLWTYALASSVLNLLGENARHHLNKIVFYVFSPSLIAANLAKTITFQSFLTLWFMPINILITFLIGAILGWMLVKVTKPPKHLKGLIIGACSAGNMGNLPIILVPAMCKEKGSPFGATDVCETYALSYASLSMAIGAVYLWSFVYNIIRISAQEVARDKEAINYSSINIKESNQEPLLPCSEDLVIHPHSKSLVSLPVKIHQCIRTFLEKANLKAVFAPSTIAAILGFTIGMVSPIQKLMIGNDAPLHVVTDSAFMLGEAAIPARTIILGANLLKGLKGTSIQLRVILGIVVTRYVILPLLGIFIVKGALQVGLVPSDDKLFVFLLHIQYAMPPAMNIGTMTQLFGSGQSECSVIMLWAYSLAIVALTLWSILFLWIVA